MISFPRHGSKVRKDEEMLDEPSLIRRGPKSFYWSTYHRPQLAVFYGFQDFFLRFGLSLSLKPCILLGSNRIPINVLYISTLGKMMLRGHDTKPGQGRHEPKRRGAILPQIIPSACPLANKFCGFRCVFFAFRASLTKPRTCWGQTGCPYPCYRYPR